MPQSKLICDACHQEIVDTISDEEAEIQFAIEFPTEKRDKENDAVVCDDCFYEMFPEKRT